MHRRRFAGALAIVVSGCAIGGTAAEWPIASRPEGATVVATISSGNIQGELLEVVADGLVIKKLDGPIVLVHFNRITRASAIGLGKTYITDGTQLTLDSDGYRLVSHFPQGMRDDVRARVLSQAKQTQVMVVE